jgi:2-keto-4-pentenoate hydratase/2-oxohepta-3-ene-1,7-dioic acid hydratase in catechol pathway
MKTNRRNFLRVAGVAGALAATGRLARAEAAEKAPARKTARGLARGLTLLHFQRDGQNRLGVKTEKGILDAAEAAKLLRMPCPATIDDLLQNEEGPALNAVVDKAAKSKAVEKAYLEESRIQHGPVVTRPEKIVCVGLNYRKHAAEIGAQVPKQPVLFNKFNNALNCHNGTVKLPVWAASHFDYEVELVMLIGKRASRVSEADALSYVAGYSTGNDFTARDLQLETGGQWMVGKTPDQFAPVGPYMVTADQIDPDNLKIELRLNGETRQSSNTSDFIFNTRKMISYISQVITLQPGDIIYTGTPEGVIQGKAPDKRVWLKAGDKIACSLEKLGELRFELT